MCPKRSAKVPIPRNANQVFFSFFFCGFAPEVKSWSITPGKTGMWSSPQPVKIISNRWKNVSEHTIKGWKREMSLKVTGLSASYFSHVCWACQLISTYCKTPPLFCNCFPTMVAFLSWVFQACLTRLLRYKIGRRSRFGAWEYEVRRSYGTANDWQQWAIVFWIWSMSKATGLKINLFALDTRAINVES